MIIVSFHPSLPCWATSNNRQREKKMRPRQLGESHSPTHRRSRAPMTPFQNAKRFQAMELMAKNRTGSQPVTKENASITRKRNTSCALHGKEIGQFEFSTVKSQGDLSSNKISIQARDFPKLKSNYFHYQPCN